MPQHAPRASRQPARGEDPEATSIRAACNAQAEAEVRRDEGPDGRGVTERQGGIEVVHPGDNEGVGSIRRPHVVLLRPGVSRRGPQFAGIRVQRGQGQQAHGGRSGGAVAAKVVQGERGY